MSLDIRRQILRGLLSWRFMLLAMGVPLAIFVGYTAAGIAGVTGSSIDDVVWPTYFMVSMAAFGAMTAAVGVAAGRLGTATEGPDERTEQVQGVRAGQGMLVRLASAIALALPPLVLLGLAGALEGIRLPGGEWFALVISLWLGALPFVALGLLLGPVLDADTGDVVLLGLLIVLAILGGLFQPIETFPGTPAAVALVLPSYHLADLGRTVIAAHAADPVDVLVLAAYTVGIGAVTVWRRRIEDARVGQ